MTETFDEMQNMEEPISVNRDAFKITVADTKADIHIEMIMKLTVVVFIWVLILKYFSTEVIDENNCETS